MLVDHSQHLLGLSLPLYPFKFGSNLHHNPTSATQDWNLKQDRMMMIEVNMQLDASSF